MTDVVLPPLETHNGYLYNRQHIEYWKLRAEGAEAAILKLQGEVRDALTARDTATEFMNEAIAQSVNLVETAEADVARMRETVQMARTRLDQYADAANAGQAQGGGREFKRKIWGAFADFDALVQPGERT